MALNALRAALDVVLRDLASANGPVATVRDEWWSADSGRTTAMIFGADGVGQGVWVQDDRPVSEQIASTADQVQDWAVEELAAHGRPATWPECPDHPDSHPLSPEVLGQRAVWICPTTRIEVSAIGELPAPRDRPTRQDRGS